MLQVTFPEIARVLADLHSTIPAPESHGCLCGALCVSVEYTLDQWLDEIVPEESAADIEQAREPLKLLFEDTVRALRGDEMEFEPLLPDDDVALEARAGALSQWCQGFLYGFGTGEPPAPEEMPTNIDEVLRDIAQIGRATIEVNEAEEEQEEAYAEVIEYVRVGVQLIHDELRGVRADKSADRQQPN
jgi:uncharacterized protein YgfB (UPF0149 family)